MACGIPVISTTGGALPELLGQSGLLVPPADSRALAKAIAQLCDDPELAQKLGKAGRQRVIAHFTWEAAARKTLETYYRVMDDYRRSNMSAAAPPMSHS
jgi:glycosyltransferase involved in cell wall biosynthesis